MLAYAYRDHIIIYIQSHCLIRFNSFFYKLFQFIISFVSREVEHREEAAEMTFDTHPLY